MRAIVFATSILIFSCAALEQKPKSANVTLSSESSEIVVESPLLTKILFTNEDNETITLIDKPLGEIYGTMGIEIQKPGEKEYVLVVTPDLGKSDEVSFQGDQYLHGERFAEYVLLSLNSENEYVFNAVGTYKVRAFVQVDRKKIMSNSVNVDVKERDANSIHVLNDQYAILKKCLSITTCSARKDIDAIDHKYPRDFENIMQFADAFSSLYEHATTATTKGEAELDRIANSDMRLWNELSRLVLAEHFARHNRHKEAEAMLTKIKERSCLHDAARKLIQQADNR